MANYSSHPGWVTLMDGPGENKKFAVHRAPIFLRVVSTREGIWDTLDEIDDFPEANEEIHVYRQLSWIHVRANKRSESGVYYDYVHVQLQTHEKATLRYNRQWREWAKQATEELERQTDG